MSMVRRFRPSVRMLILAAAGVIIALAWFGAHATMVAQRAAAQARAEMDVQSKARLVAEQLRRDLLVVDQTLYIMELEWQRNPTGFDFESWRRRVLALTAMSLQIFIADQHGIVRWSSRPEILGDDVSQRDYFRAKSALPVDDEQMFIGSLTRGLLTRRWQVNLARRLDHPDRSFAGEIVASYDPAAFQRFQHDAALAPHGLLVITAPDGTIDGVGDLALAGTARSLAGTPVFAAMRRSAQGRWIGPSPLDGMDRILAFATVPDRGLQVLVGIDRARAMRAPANWDRQVMLFTGLFTALILLMAAVLIWADHAIRGRHAAAIRDRVVLARANVQLEAAEGRERVKAAQLAATLAGMSDGIMMVDAQLRLLAWNEHFPEFTGVPADILRPGLPMEDMLRAQARANEFGAV
ncbi:MAG TPA: PAS-domain containing protein, partial [Acetobacteraceae bacterium]|nr:PAS-domain containing protein [Acetobacteraceae bacterium]